MWPSSQNTDYRLGFITCLYSQAHLDTQTCEHGYSEGMKEFDLAVSRHFFLRTWQCNIKTFSVAVFPTVYHITLSYSLKCDLYFKPHFWYVHLYKQAYSIRTFVQYSLDASPGHNVFSFSLFFISATVFGETKKRYLYFSFIVWARGIRDHCALHNISTFFLHLIMSNTIVHSHNLAHL